MWEEVVVVVDLFLHIIVDAEPHKNSAIRMIKTRKIGL